MEGTYPLKPRLVNSDCGASGKKALKCYDRGSKVFVRVSKVIAHTWVTVVDADSDINSNRGNNPVGFGIASPTVPK